MALPYTLKHYGREGVKRRIKKNLNSALNLVINSARMDCIVRQDDILKRIGEAISKHNSDPNDENSIALLSIVNGSRLIIGAFASLTYYLRSHFYQCYCCSEYVVEVSQAEAENNICQPCIDEYYTYSELMDCYVNNDEICNSEDGYATEWWFSENGYTYSGDLEQFVLKYKVWPNHILEYHESKQYIGKIDDAREDRQINPLYCGFELEFETGSHDDDEDDYDSSNADLDYISKDILKSLRRETDARCYICAEEDGSLDSGFELVSSYTGIDTHWDRLQRFNSIRSISDGDISESSGAGLHVHVSRKKLSLYTCAKVASFMSNPDNEEFLNKFARRRPNSYWKRKTKKQLSESFRAARCNGISKLNYDRYEIVNFHNRNTIEFRLYKSSTCANTIMACIEFSRAVVAYCRTAGLHQLTIRDLLRWVYRPENKLDTLRLRLHLKRYFVGLHEDFAPIEKPNRRPEKLVATS